MNISAQENLAELLRKFILSCPGLPVSGGSISLDSLGAEGPSMGLHITAGEVLKEFASGRKRIRQTFYISYQAATTTNDSSRSKMIGAINSIGRWLEEAPFPFLGDGIQITKLGQVVMAHLIEQGNARIAYYGDFVLEYTYRPQTRKAA